MDSSSAGCVGQMFSPGHCLPPCVRTWLPSVRPEWLTQLEAGWLLMATPSVHLSNPFWVHTYITAWNPHNVNMYCVEWITFFIWNMLPRSFTDFLFSSSHLLPLQETIGEHFPCSSRGENWFANSSCLWCIFSEKEIVSLISYRPKTIPYFVLSWFFLQLLVHFNPSQKK